MRAFLAIPLPTPVRRCAAEIARAALARTHGFRPVREEGLHVTLRFFGDADAARLAALHSDCSNASASFAPIELRVGSLRAIPTARRPRLLWLAVEDGSPDGALGRLAVRLEEIARAHGFPPEDRPFAPHVAVARARGGARANLDAPLDDAVAGDFVADRIVLFRSELTSGGSIYHEQASYALGAAGS
jgi:2'-5' RNA ligase